MHRFIARAILGASSVVVAGVLGIGAAGAQTTPEGTNAFSAISQQAGARATSSQVLPADANSPLAAFSNGANNGHVSQQNNSSPGRSLQTWPGWPKRRSPRKAMLSGGALPTETSVDAGRMPRPGLRRAQKLDSTHGPRPTRIKWRRSM